MEFIPPIQIVLYFFYFILVVLVTFSLPGYVILSNMSLTRFQRFVVGTMVGLSLWAFQGFIFGFLHARFLTYGYLLVFLILGIYQWYSSKKRVLPIKFSFHFSRQIYIFFFIILLGVFVQVSSVFFTGLSRNGDLYFCCGNNNDFLYDLSLSKNLITMVPPLEPGFEGIIVHNYHYLSNLVVADLYRVFSIPLSLLEFQFSFIFLSLFLGLLIVAFGQILKKNVYFTYWLLFFFYFGGDCIWFLMILLNSGSHFFSMDGIEDGTKFLMNLPRTFAVDIFLGVLSLFTLWIQRFQSKKLLFLTGLVAGTLIGFKVYIGIFILFGLGVVSIYYLFRKQMQPLFLLLITLVTSLMLYIPVNSGAGGFYFTGLWIFENFIVQPYLRLDRLELARVIYAQHHSWIRVASYEFLYIVIMLFAVFGTKLLGLVQTKRSLKQLPVPLHIVLLSGLVFSFIFGFFFQQTSGGANTFNFIVNILLFGNIYVALALSYIFYNKKYIGVSAIIAIVVILLTIPRVVYQIMSNINDVHAGKGLIISSSEINGFAVLNTYPRGVVLVDSHNIPLDKATPYITLFTTQPLFASGITIADSHAVVKVEKKNASIKKIFLSKNPGVVAQELQKNNITYIISKPGKMIFMATQAAQFVSPLYQNKKIEIFKFSKNQAKLYIKM